MARPLCRDRAPFSRCSPRSASLSYLLRTNISVAAKLMMPELGIDEVGMGRVFGAFLLGYSVFQVPWSIAGDRWGVRVPLAIRFLLGFGEAAMYPLPARAVSPGPRRWRTAGVAFRRTSS